MRRRHDRVWCLSLSSSRPARALLIALSLFLYAVGSAASEPGRLALVEPDAELERAVRVALSAWRTDVIRANIRGPGNTMPGSADTARAVARQYAALAVIWISKSDDGYALWMYDARADRVVARRLSSPPPFDDATAASVALAVKTLLRHSDLPPPTERLAVPATPRPWLSASLLGALRPAATAPNANELRFGLRGMAWPFRATSLLVFGGGLEVTAGPGVPIEGPRFAGRWTETMVLVVASLRLDLGSDIDLSLDPGFGTSITHLGGSSSETSEASGITRANLLAALRAGAGYRAGPLLRFGLSAGMQRPLRTQAYRVGGVRVLDVRSLNFEGVLSVEASVF